jgi:hypothetical protein
MQNPLGANSPSPTIPGPSSITITPSLSGVNLNAGITSGIAQSVPDSHLDPVSSNGWLDWNHVERYLIEDLNIVNARDRIAEKWLISYGNEDYRKKYYFIANTGSEIVSYVSDSATGSTEFHSILFIWAHDGNDKLIVQESETSTESTVEPSAPAEPTSPIRNSYREDFAPVDPTMLSIAANSSSVVFKGIVQSDNLRFDINSSNMFAGMVESQNVETSIISDSYSPIEKEGISASRLKTILVSDYDLIDTISSTVLGSSLEYSKMQHDNLYRFYNEVLFPEIDLLTELEDTYNRKKFRLLKAIQFIKEIDEFKMQFINTVTDYDSYGLQILGYLPGLNATTAIRQAFYDLSSYVEIGGYFLSNNLNGVYETPTGISTHHDSFNPRKLSINFQEGYEFQTVDNQENTLTEILDSTHSISDELSKNREAFGDYIIYRISSGFEAQRASSPPALRSTKLYEGIKEDWNKFNETINSVYNDSKSAKAAHLAQGVYVNILKSYIVNSNNLSDAEDLGEEYFGTRNYLLGIAGSAIDDRSGGPQPLADLDNSKKLAQILRFNSAENSVYPFEKPNVRFSGDSTNSVSGIEKWFDSNLGNIIEGRETDFRGLDNFSKIFEDIISKTEKKLNALNLRGHGQIIFNEIIRVFQKVYDGSLDTEAHPQPGLAALARKGGFVFDDYKESTITYKVENVLEDIENAEETEQESVAGFTAQQQDAAEISAQIIDITVQEGLEDAAEQIAVFEGLSDDLNAIFDTAMTTGGFLPDQPGADEFVGSADISVVSLANVGAEIGTDELIGLGEGYGAVGYGVAAASTNAIGETSYGAPLNVSGGNSAQIQSVSPAFSSMTNTHQTMSYLSNDLSASTAVGVYASTDGLDSIPSAYEATQGILDAELRAGFAKGKEHLFRKLMFIINMFANISSASDEEFWNLSYNSVQGQLEVNPKTPGYGTDHKRYKKYIRLLTQNDSLYDNYDTGISMYSHGLSIINSICSEVEKYLAYDVAVASNEYGITNRTPGEYSNSNAISILTSVFNNIDTKLIYNTQTPKPFSEDSKNIYLSGHDLYESFGSSKSASLTHPHLRALILEIIALTCKVIKSQNNITMALTSVTNYPKEEGKISKGYVTVNSNLDRLKLEAAVTQMFLPVIENVDPSKGPVRWQINYGDWVESGLKLENQNFVNQFVLPKGVEKTLAGEFSLDIQIGDHVIPRGDLGAYTETLQFTPTELGTPDIRKTINNDIKNMEASIRANFEFLLRKEDIVPYNFVDNKEIPIRSFAIAPPRGGLAPIIKACIYHREDSRRIMEYLKSVAKHYSLAQQNMEGLIKDPNGAELADSATLPGVEANEIIKYSSLRQTFLRSFLASEESGIEKFGYSPSATYMDSEINQEIIKDVLNELLLSVSLIKTTSDDVKFFLGKPESEAYGTSSQISSLDRQASNHHLKFGKIMSIGIPAGFIDQNKSSKSIDILNRLIFLEQEFQPLVDKELNSLWRCFWPGLFINRAELIRTIKRLQSSGNSMHWTNLISELKYGTIDKDTGRYVIKDEASITEYIESNIISSPNMIIPTNSESEAVVEKPTAKHIIVNHVLDALLKLYMDLYAGLNLAESSFSVNLQSNILYVDQTCLDNIDLVLEYTGIKSAEDILDGNTIIPFKSFYKKQTFDSNSEVAYEKYAKFVATTQSRLFSADQMTTMALVPNIFDRTFNIWSHMGQVSFYSTNSQNENTLNFYDISDDGTVNSDGVSENMAYNDFNAQTYFRGYSS